MSLLNCMDKFTHILVADDGTCTYRDFPIANKEWIEQKIVMEIFYFEPAKHFCVTFAPFLVVEQNTMERSLEMLKSLNEKL
jgi:hypothetical protein